MFKLFEAGFAMMCLPAEFVSIMDERSLKQVSTEIRFGPSYELTFKGRICLTETLNPGTLSPKH